MSGIVPIEGRREIALLVFNRTSADRGVTLQLGMFTNPSVSSATTMAQITEPTGGAYARFSLADANWSVDANGVATFAQRIFVATGSDMTGVIRGYFLATTGTVPRLLCLEVDPTVPGGFSMRRDDEYRVTPRVVIS